MEKLTIQWALKCASLLLLINLTACSSLPEESEDGTSTNADVEAVEADPRDPFEGFNRTMWDFNYDVLDKYILRPVAVGYRDYMPMPARSGLLNAAENLEEPSSFINNTLQGKFADAGTTFGRFVINSTLGLFGLFDIASRMGLEAKHESFGETLGVWGVGSGPFLMLPAMGPTDVRDSSGNYVDGLYFPLDNLDTVSSIGRLTVKALEARIRLIDQEQMLEDSFDPYVFVKEAYIQNSEFKVKDGRVEPEVDEDEFEDFSDFEDELEGL